MKVQKVREVTEDRFGIKCSEHLPQPPFLMTITAPRKSGKTNNLIDMLLDEEKYCHKFDFIAIWSKTVDHDSKWKNLNLMKEFVFENFVEDQVRKLYEDVELLSKKKNIKSLFIFDDMIDQHIMSPMKMGVLETIAVRGRHIGLSIIIISQQYMKLSPPIRNNCTNGLFYRIRNNKERKVIREENQEMLSKNDFDSLLDYATEEPYAFLHINNQVADPHQRFRKNWDEVLYLHNLNTHVEEEEESDRETETTTSTTSQKRRLAISEPRLSDLR